MGIYTLAIKNLRRNRIRNISTIIRISVGVLTLLILLGSGLGITSFLDQLNSFGQDNITSNISEISPSANQITSNVRNYFNSTFGIDLEESTIPKSLKNIILRIIDLIDGLASIALLIGVLGVMTTMYFNEAERKREVGLLKIMGFSERQIMLSLTIEGALLGFIASIIGIIFGALVLFLITSVIGFISFDLVLPWWMIFAAMFITTFLSFILGLYPAWLASKNDVSLVFRNE